MFGLNYFIFGLTYLKFNQWFVSGFMVIMVFGLFQRFKLFGFIN
jgi:hypothetical protein